MSGLLDRAQQRAIRANRPFDTLHIILEAVENADDQDPVGHIILQNTAPAQRQRWINRLEGELDQKPPASKDGKTERLANCEKGWKDLAGEGVATDEQILRTVLADNDTITAIGDTPTRMDIIGELGNHKRRNSQGPDFGASGITAAKAEEHAKAVAGKLCLPVEPLPDLPYRTFVSNDTTTFLNRLAVYVKEQFEVLICFGPDGSLINVLQHVIADHLAFRDSFVLHQAPLNGYSGLFRIDVRQLFTEKTADETLDMALVLKAAKALVRGRPDRPAILLVDHVETIPESGVDADKLKTQIAIRDQTLMFGIYHAPDDKDYTQPAKLKQASTRVLPIHASSDEDTLQLIETFYIRQLWTKRGYTFAPHAFKDLIKLEAGAWIDKRRIMLPGMATQIAEDTMDTIQEGVESARTTAKGAREALKALKRDTRPAAEVRAKYAEVLRRAESVAKPMTTRRRPSRWHRIVTAIFGAKEEGGSSAQNATTVTSAHLLAQLLCVNNSEFVYPPFPPEGAL